MYYLKTLREHFTNLNGGLSAVGEHNLRECNFRSMNTDTYYNNSTILLHTEGFQLEIYHLSTFGIVLC